MKKFLKNLLIIILILLSIVLIFNKQITATSLKHYNDQRVEKITRKQIVKNEKAKADYNFANVKQLGPGKIINGMIGGYIPIIGAISVPSVGIKLPIAKGVSNMVLATSGGTMKPNQKMGEGNYALAGHDYKSIFMPTHDIKLGDKIYISDFKNVYEYEVYSKKAVEPTEVNVIDDVKGQKIITLITCTDNNTKRLATQGRLVSKKAKDKNTIKIITENSKEKSTRNKYETSDILMMIGGLLILIILVLTLVIKKRK
ncbi:class A sortase [Companilactobacillus sp. DQM5]|uniref:class A sortase n=1 Tax=Companilactobacillus sp. DQM5 TaxID=3463359 RepID=UPI0040591CB4